MSAARAQHREPERAERAERPGPERPGRRKSREILARVKSHEDTP